MDWTEERVAELKKLWLEGQSASQVARKLGGVSRNAVIGKVHRMGFVGRDVPTRPRGLGGSSNRRPRSTNNLAAPRRKAVRLVQSEVSGARMPDLEPTATLLTLGAEGCRWPIGNPQDATFGFCGRQRGDQISYCHHHAQLAFRRPATSGAGSGRERFSAWTHGLSASAGQR